MAAAGHAAVALADKLASIQISVELRQACWPWTTLGVAAWLGNVSTLMPWPSLESHSFGVKPRPLGLSTLNGNDGNLGVGGRGNGDD
jgi:hypothetical protein